MYCRRKSICIFSNNNYKLFSIPLLENRRILKNGTRQTMSSTYLWWSLQNHNKHEYSRCLFAVFHRTFVTFKSSNIIYHETNKNTIASPWIYVIADRCRRDIAIFVHKSRRLRLNCSIQGNNHSIDQFLREIPDIELVSIQLIGLKCTW